MTGSTLAAILIPPAGTIFLVAWLAVVFYAGRDHPREPGATRRLAARAPAPGRCPPTGSGARGGDSAQVRQRRRLASPGPGTTIAAATPAGTVAAQIGGGNHAPRTPGAVPERKVVQGVPADRLPRRMARQGEADHLGRQADVSAGPSVKTR